MIPKLRGREGSTIPSFPRKLRPFFKFDKLDSGKVNISSIDEEVYTALNVRYILDNDTTQRDQ